MNAIEAMQPQFKTGLRRGLRGLEPMTWKEKDVGINVVFGISENGLPARFLSGFTPAFGLAEAIAKQHFVMPELRVFVPLHLSERANGIQLSHGEQTVKQGVLFVQKFQEIFHPSVSWFLDIDQPMLPQTVNLLINLSDQLLSKKDPSLLVMWEKAFDAAQKRGNKESAKLYTPHHIFGWHDAWEPDKFFPAPTKPITINCFSTSEATFQPVRSALMPIVTEQMPELVVHGKHLNLFTDRCPGPHYMPRELNGKREALLMDMLSVGFTKTRRDLHALGSEGFKTAIKDLDSINAHIEDVRKNNPRLPNIEEFISEVRHATE